MIKRAFRGVTAIQVISLVVFAALVASVLGVGYLLLQDRDRVVNNNDRLIQIYDDLYRQSQAEGIDPTTPDPSSVKNDSQSGNLVGPRGETGSAGQAGRAPTGAEVLAAVRSYCSANNDCMGERGQAGAKGDKGDPGAASTVPGPSGVAGSNGKDSTVAGPAGSNGLDGANGSTGATGPQGPPGADSTVPGPVGPSGAPGANGLNGADGRGVGGISCMMGSDLLNTYFVFYDTAGLEISRVAGSCVPG
jgi:hypothetical protein